MKDLTALLIELDEVNRRLDRIQNDPGYIEARGKEIYKDRPRKDYRGDLEKMLADF